MSLEHLLGQWGLPALFLGGFLEGEAAGFAGGMLAHRGFFPFGAAVVALAAGGFAMDQTAFHLGRHARGAGWVARLLARPGTAAMAARIAARPIFWAAALRWIYGLRIVTAMALGASGARPLPVLAAGLASALVWALTVTAAGYGLAAWVGGIIGNFALHHHLALMIAVGLAVALAVGHFSHRLLRNRPRR